MTAGDSQNSTVVAAPKCVSIVELACLCLACFFMCSCLREWIFSCCVLAIFWPLPLRYAICAKHPMRTAFIYPTIITLRSHLKQLYRIVFFFFCDGAGGSSGGGGLNLDDMLSDLTSNPIADLAPGTGSSGPSSASSASLSKRKRGMVTPQSARSRRSSTYGSTSSRGSSAGSSGRRPPVPSAWTVRDYEDDAGASGDADDDGDVDGVQHFDGDNEDATGDSDAAMQDVDITGESSRSDPGAAAAATADESGDVASEEAAAGGETKPAAVSPETPAGETAAAAKPRSRFARLKETNNIAVTAAAEAALYPKKAESIKKEPEAAAAAVDGKGGEGKAGGVGSSYMPSLEFQGPQYSLNAAPSTPAGAVPSTSSWLQKV